MPRLVTWIVAAVVLALSSPAEAQSRKWYLNAFAGQSIIVIGSKDNRTLTGLGASYSFGKQARLRWGSQPGELMGELYYDLSQGPRWGTHPENSAQAWGLLALARYYWTQPGSPKMFADIGWGVQHAGVKTRDLSSKLNSTPFFDLGVLIGSDHTRSLVGVRFMHVSNGGAVRRNKGQNEIFLFVQLPI